jgi:hypothetical protein
MNHRAIGIFALALFCVACWTLLVSFAAFAVLMALSVLTLIVSEGLRLAELDRMRCGRNAVWERRDAEELDKAFFSAKQAFCDPFDDIVADLDDLPWPGSVGGVP